MWLWADDHTARSCGGWGPRCLPALPPCTSRIAWGCGGLSPPCCASGSQMGWLAHLWKWALSFAEFLANACWSLSITHPVRDQQFPPRLLRSQTFCSGCFSLQRPSNPLQGSGEHPTHTLTGLAAGIWGHLSGCGGEGRPCPSGHVERGSLRHCGGTATRACRSYFHMSLYHLVPAGATGPTTLRCPAIVLAEQDLWAHVPAQPWPTPVPKEVPSAQGCGCPSAPWLPWFWFGQWNGPQLSGPALTDTGTPQNSQPKGSPGLLQQPAKI